MKKWHLIILLLSLLANGDILSKDMIDPGRVNIKSKTGETKGWLKKDTLDPDRINIYDKDGNLKGYFTRDNISPYNRQYRRNGR